ncbi:Ran_BP1 domain-containing protein/NUP50 domain-containing protein [Cephalotus follicularis]|uniref:Ran_BP1 domain-containing protein/NUP50 domain-containing protein n=1 Tax=Cephalotus follicularis TaxID=3775 RepID=A0A1Q3BXC9_CEPFO|nr:Ran_BP1 domain-containing protein/NUP50 domain-containing protein [Cephalotus follicularis]
MGDADNTLPPSKKRAAGRELSRENPGLDDEDSTEQEAGTFKRASEEVLAGRRIVKVRRPQASSTPSSNPFAGIRLVPPTDPHAPSPVVTTGAITAGDRTVSDVKEETETVKQMQSGNKTDEQVSEVACNKESDEDKNKDVVTEASKSEDNEIVAGGDKIDSEGKKDGSEDEKNESEDKEDKNENKNDERDSSSEKADPSAEGSHLSSFQQLSSSQNAFQGLAGTGFSTSTFSFGSISKDGSSLGSSSFGFGSSTNGNSSLFNAPGPSLVSKSEGSGLPSMQEVAIETGEENENVVFSADSVLFEFLDGVWKERGKGELKVNVSKTGTEKARLVMRARGNYRLILNASIYPDMKLAYMDKKGITFACMNSTGEGKEGLSTFALKFKAGSILEDFRAAVLAHKVISSTTLKTPENSPKASDD